MPCSQVAYSNLRAEMARLNITIQDIARECGYNRNTLSRRLSKKSPLLWEDALKIQREMFWESDVQWLFREE